MLFERNKGFPGVDRLHGVVDAFHIIALVSKEGTLPQRDNLVSCGENVGGHCGIHHVSGRSQFIQGQAGDTIHQHMALVSPVKLEASLVVLVGGGVNAQGAVRVTFNVAALWDVNSVTS